MSMQIQGILNYRMDILFQKNLRSCRSLLHIKLVLSPFGNFSGTGAGKTLSAVLSSRVIGSKLTVIVCPNDIVKQWEDEIYKIFPAGAGSSVLHGKQHLMQNIMKIDIICSKL